MRDTVARPGVHLGLPHASVFRFPPDSYPATVPAPTGHGSFASPFSINEGTYNKLLDARLPFTVAALYLAAVTILNGVNRRRDNKPWPLSQTRLFSALVLLHNIALAVFSTLTFIGLIRAVHAVWPGLFAGEHAKGVYAHGPTAIVDAFCKLHGPRGLGDAAAWNSTNKAWAIKNSLVHLNTNSQPETTDVGRLWNEGLAFWGWTFYLSKFYETLDTAIILAKGKRSSTLQSYHHAGAMICMWAGIRYMSPPIWMFVLVNSGIHALMYVYYSLSTLDIAVSQRFKRAITTMQIAQFILGFTYAGLHLFVYYNSPTSTSYSLLHTITAAIPSATSAVANAASTASAAIVSGGVGGLLKKLAYRAAGEEGLAENVRNKEGYIFGPEAQHLAETIKSETRYRETWEKTPCIDTSGQAFAIYINLVYLLPLTLLFLRFFVRSYRSRMSVKDRPSNQASAARDASKDALRQVEAEFDRFGEKVENKLSSAAERAKQAGHDIADGRVPESVGELERRIQRGGQQAYDTIKDGGKHALDSARDNSKYALDSARDGGKHALDSARDGGKQALETVKGGGKQALETVKGGGKQAIETVKDGSNAAAGAIKDKAAQAGQKVKELTAEAQKRIESELREAQSDDAGSKKAAQQASGDGETKKPSPPPTENGSVDEKKQPDDKDKAGQPTGQPVGKPAVKSGDGDKPQHQQHQNQHGHKKGKGHKGDQQQADSKKDSKGKDDPAEPKKGQDGADATPPETKLGAGMGAGAGGASGAKLPHGPAGGDAPPTDGGDGKGAKPTA